MKSRMLLGAALCVFSLGISAPATAAAPVPTAAAPAASPAAGAGPAKAAASAADASASSEPVIVLHGWIGTGAGVGMLREAFTAAGHPAYTIDLPGQDNIVNAHALAGLVATVKQQTGATKVHLVAHSMGALAARYYIRNLGGADSVRTYVSLGSPQYGYWPACLLLEVHGGQMCPWSPFLRDLNAGDDTPGSIAYFTFRSSEDTPDVTRLDGGACFHEIPGVRHSAEPTSAPFIAAALDAVAGVCPGTFVVLPTT